MKLLYTSYSFAPYPLKVAMASTRGYYLRLWRYGSETIRLVNEALQRERWEPDRWEAWQQQRLAVMLRMARHEVPFYRAYWDELERGRESGDWQVLSNWPILKKEQVRSNPSAFVRDCAHKGRLFLSRTSGSTGTPLTLYCSRVALRTWYALFEARWRGWNGLSRLDRWAIIGGQRVVPIDRRKPPYWVWNAGLRQLYISAYHIAPWSAGPIVEAMRKARVRYLWGYASAMAELAREVVRQGLRPPRLEAIISNAEPLLEEQRRTLNEAFGARVVNTYGMAEMVAAASECEQGSLHLWPEAGFVEVLDDDGRACPPGEVGRLICTGLLNDAMILVRYEVGDCGALGPSDVACACGRTLPILQDIEGRLDDVIVTPDGRRIGRLDTVFKSDLPICRAQIVQDALERLVVNVQPAEGYDRRTAAAIEEALRERVGGELHIEVREIDEIPRTANGKLRAVISKVARGEAAG